MEPTNTASKRTRKVYTFSKLTDKLRRSCHTLGCLSARLCDHGKNRRHYTRLPKTSLEANSNIIDAHSNASCVAKTLEEVTKKHVATPRVQASLENTERRRSFGCHTQCSFPIQNKELVFGDSRWGDSHVARRDGIVSDEYKRMRDEYYKRNRNKELGFGVSRWGDSFVARGDGIVSHEYKRMRDEYKRNRNKELVFGDSRWGDSLVARSDGIMSDEYKRMRDEYKRNRSKELGFGDSRWGDSLVARSDGIVSHEFKNGNKMFSREDEYVYEVNSWCRIKGFRTKFRRSDFN